MENTTKSTSYEVRYATSYPFRCDYDSARNYAEKLAVARKAVQVLNLTEENTQGDWYFETWVKITK